MADDLPPLDVCLQNESDRETIDSARVFIARTFARLVERVGLSAAAQVADEIQWTISMLIRIDEPELRRILKEFKGADIIAHAAADRTREALPGGKGGLR